MNRQQYLLTCVSEECNEVGHRASKQARFGDGQRQTPQHPANHERTWEEFLQLVAVMEMAGFPVRNRLACDYADVAISRKKERVEETIKESAGYGLVNYEAIPRS